MTLGAGERDEQQRELWRRGAQGWERRQEALTDEASVRQATRGSAP